MRDLKYHKIAFEENLEELLLPLIADEETIQKLLSSPGGKEWDNLELEKQLKARMPKAYSSYLDVSSVLLPLVSCPMRNRGYGDIAVRAVAFGRRLCRDFLGPQLHPHMKYAKSTQKTMEMMKETLEKLEECLGMNKVHFQNRVTEEYVSLFCASR